MNIVPTVVGSKSVGSPDRQTLRAIKRFLSEIPMISDAELHPDSYHPQRVNALVNTGEDSSATGQIEIRWYTSGDFSIRYHESGTASDPWDCQWDNHTNTEITQRHLHHPEGLVEIAQTDFPPNQPIDIVISTLSSLADSHG